METNEGEPTPGSLESGDPEQEPTPDYNPEHKSKEEVEAEEAAMEKVINPAEKKYYIHSTFSSVLANILEYGLIPHSLAHRAKKMGLRIKEPKKNYDISQENSISVIAPDIELDEFVQFPAFELTSLRNLSILIDNKGVINPLPDPYYRRNRGFVTLIRVKPEFIIGLIAGLTDDIDEKHLAHRRMIELAKMYRKPIYNKWGDLLWPRKMTLEEVKQFVAERGKKKGKEKGKKEKGRGIEL